MNGNILICTDEAIQAFFVRRVLTGAGYDVSQQKQASLIHQDLRLPGLDLVLIDVSPNECSGQDFAREVLDKAECPVILLRTSLSADGPDSFARAAATLCKPFTAAELLSTVETVLAAYPKSGMSSTKEERCRSISIEGVCLR